MANFQENIGLLSICYSLSAVILYADYLKVIKVGLTGTFIMQPFFSYREYVAYNTELAI